MFSRLVALLSALVFSTLLLVSSASAQAPAEPPRDEAAEFADLLLEVTTLIQDSYFVEVPRAQLLDLAIRGLYYRAHQGNMPSDLDQRLRRLGRPSDAESRALLVDAWKGLKPRGGATTDYLLDLGLEEMTRQLDNRTRVFWQGPRVPCHARWVPEGVGLSVRADPATRWLAVLNPDFDGPAYRAGLRAGDFITRITNLTDVDGHPLASAEELTTKGILPADANDLIWGRSKTRVRLTILRPGVEEPWDVELTRGRVRQETVLGYRRNNDDRFDYWIDAKAGLAYVRLAGLTEDTAEELKRTLARLQEADIRGLVLDLRFSPAGLLSTAVKVSRLFIDDGPILSIRPRVGREFVYRAVREASYLDLPMACLVNGETVSCNEAIAACLQDHHRAVVMGERTMGKAGVTNLQQLGEDRLLQLLTAVFRRPNGKILQRTRLPGPDYDDWGVIPDPKYALQLSLEEYMGLADHLQRQTLIRPREQYGKANGPAFRDRQLEMAVAYLRAQSARP